MAQFSLYVHKGGLKPDKFFVISNNYTRDKNWFNAETYILYMA